MRYDLRALFRRTRNPRRRQIVLRDIAPPAVMATNLYQAAYAPVFAPWERAALDIIEVYSFTIMHMVNSPRAAAPPSRPSSNSKIGVIPKPYDPATLMEALGEIGVIPKPYDPATLMEALGKIGVRHRSGGNG
ncbi:hypothetical protein [Sphingomonas sp. M1-B02]|uniref:hypothetical protein n=1 Tax=Sphingomonas sp. M1-B02 TaxID=3114300 RepID=UPI00223F7807|nr:hypothetical protein [Sphingomonas sp. S6-11]UZK67675.1 hypothetical protein OKW87_07555 [Sphingomonas sp. S6-11]